MLLVESSVEHSNGVTSETGFSIYEEVFSADQCHQLEHQLQSIPRRGRAGTRHLMSNQFVGELALDYRLIEIAQRWLSKAPIPYRATLFEKTSRANWLVVWHQDSALPLSAYNSLPEWGPWSNKDGVIYAHAPAWALERIVALRIHLDASSELNGPLRIIPGSHSIGVLSDEKVFEIARQEGSVTCLVPRGGVLAMRPLLIHSSSKSENDARRRVLHIEYADSLDLSESIKLAVA